MISYAFNSIFRTSVKFHYTITKSWDGITLDQTPYNIILEGISVGVLVKIRGPFFNDTPNPGGKPGQPALGLWEYEGLYI